MYATVLLLDFLATYTPHTAEMAGFFPNFDMKGSKFIFKKLKYSLASSFVIH